MEELKKPERKQECSKLMAAAYNIPADDAMKMFDDAHNTNWAENYQFFLNQNNPTNFERVWRQSYYLYRQIGTIQNPPVPFDQIMDFSVIQKLGSEEKYKSQTDEYQVQIAPTTVGKIRAESAEILTNTVVIHFAPNDWDLHKKKDDGSLYDPNVDNVLEGVGKLVGTFGGARVIIEGHTDSSMKGQVPAEVVKTLSMNRRVAVRDALADKYPEHRRQPVLCGRHGLGPARRSAEPVGPGQEPPRRDQGLPGRETVERSGVVGSERRSTIEQCRHARWPAARDGRRHDPHDESGRTADPGKAAAAHGAAVPRTPAPSFPRPAGGDSRLAGRAMGVLCVVRLPRPVVVADRGR